MEIVSDCLGALKRVTHLPPYRIPSWCWHSDILKTILVHCRGLTFTMYYLHIKAHQDNNVSFSKLSRNAQLNCICNHAAEQRMATNGKGSTNSRGMFPLEPVGLFIGDDKMTSDTGEQIHNMQWFFTRESCKTISREISCLKALRDEIVLILAKP